MVAVSRPATLSSNLVLMKIEALNKNSCVSTNMPKMDRIVMFMKIFWAQRVVCPCPGAIYMCTTIIFKLHLL